MTEEMWMVEAVVMKSQTHIENWPLKTGGQTMLVIKWERAG
jgi:hypothetical protein